MSLSYPTNNDNSTLYAQILRLLHHVQPSIRVILLTRKKECPTCRHELLTRRSLRPDHLFDKLVKLLQTDTQDTKVPDNFTLNYKQISQRLQKASKSKFKPHISTQDLFDAVSLSSTKSTTALQTKTIIYELQDLESIDANKIRLELPLKSRVSDLVLALSRDLSTPATSIKVFQNGKQLAQRSLIPSKSLQYTLT